jgi:predicted DNA-binding transcriptional regulator AlpA
LENDFLHGGDQRPPPRCDTRGRGGHAGRRAPAAPLACDDPLLSAREGAAEVHLSLAAFWRAVAARRLPPPLYPLPRAPRWRRSELRAALDATRALPAEAKAARRAARLGPRRPD